MPTLNILNPTYLKRSTGQAKDLPDDQKSLVPAGTSFAVNRFQVENGHVLVEMTKSFKGIYNWYVFGKDCMVLDGTKLLYPSLNKAEIKLPIKWDDQMNSRYPNQAARMCFSCSVWMCCSFLYPKFAKRFPRDDDYLNFMLQFGDTTSYQAHLSALKAIGIATEYSQKGSQKELIKNLEAKKPIAIGILHHGSVKYPSGGGHWVCVGGVNAMRNQFLLFDSFGSVLDAPPYSGPIERGNGYWCPDWVLDGRWTVDTPDSDGWMLTF